MPLSNRWLSLMAALALLPLPLQAQKNASAPADLTQANNRFGLRLFRDLAHRTEESNLIFSPLGVVQTLQMNLRSARGDTRRALLRAMEANEFGVNEIEKENRALLERFDTAGPDTVLRLACGLWYRKDSRLQPDYRESVQKYYRAELGTLEDAPGNINTWAEKKTDGLITNLLSEGIVTPDTAMVLVNALYFKGSWKYPFDTNLTRARPFHQADGSGANCMMMETTGTFDTLHNEKFHAVRLPYGNGTFRMTLLLPHANSSLEELLDQTTGENWRRWSRNFRTGKEARELTVVLPKFFQETEYDLNEPLGAMGLEFLFDAGRADFIGGFPDGGMHLDRIFQKVAIEVNEEGTTAVAATAGAVTESGGEVLLFDRPFLYAIEESRTGTLLFLGVFRKPPDQVVRPNLPRPGEEP